MLVEVPVTVLVDGRPLHGLGPENFEVLDAGVRRDLYSFDLLDYSAGARAAPTPMTVAGGPDLGPRRNFLFLVDFAYPDSWDPEIGAGPITAAVHGMMDTWQDLADMLKGQFHQQDRIALAYFSPLRGLKMLQGWSTDRELVAQALEILRLMIEVKPDRLRDAWWNWEMAGRTGRSKQPEELWASLEDLLAEARTAGARADPFLPSIELSRRLFEGLVLAGKTLDDAAGPRHVVYLSTGFPGASLRDLRMLLQQFRKTHWSIQSIYTGGLGLGPGSLHLLSNETGGQVFSNSNEVSSLLSEMVEQTAVTYALMFEAPLADETPRYRKIKVKLIDGPKGAKVLHRKGYYSVRSGTAQ